MAWFQVSLVLLVFVAYHSDLPSSATVECTVRVARPLRMPSKSLSPPILERFRRSINHEGHQHAAPRSVTQSRSCGVRSTSSGTGGALRRRCAARSGGGPIRPGPRRPLSQRCPRRQTTARVSHHSWCNRTCFTECWGDWSDWSACSAPCGNAGFQEASRTVSPTAQCEQWTIKYGCPGPSQKTQACNRFCHNGGTAQTAHCECPNGFLGTCCEERVTCGDPGQPENGAVSPSGATHNYGTTATYTCDAGYQLTGDATRMCRQSGNWDGQMPTCTLIECDEPPQISQGGRTVSGITYPTGRVTYTCIAGHYMQGEAELTCGIDGQWSGAAPTCHACAQNEYKVGSNAAQVCEACPDNSHTVGTGSHAPELCVCDQGYNGPNGGPCAAITCDNLSAPQDGVLGDCGTTYQDVCAMDCREGYVRASGDAERTCELNGEWSGDALVCAPCGVDTYKSGPLNCRRCPPDTHTDGPGHGISGCVCDDGFAGPDGGPCDDVDECATSQGGCEQACVNEPGSFRCECPNPGFIVNSENPLTCTARNQCPALQPVSNGGHVCVMQTGTNTQRCEVKCNAGFEHVLPPNAWEECGPSTEWHWTSDLREVPLLPCQKAFFEGVILEAEVFYFVDQCSELTQDEIDSVQREFLLYLQIQGICTDTGTQACQIEDVTLECGEVGEGARRRRETREQMRFTFKIVVDAKETDDVDCNTLCDRPDASERYCQQTCAENYQQNITQAISDTVEETLAIQVQRPGEDAGESVSQDFTLAGVTMTPQGRAAVTSTVATCGTGMVSNDGVCAPCPAGTKLQDNECQDCPIFTYQPEPRQTRCLTCLWAAGPGYTRCRNPLEIVGDVIEDVVNGDEDEEEAGDQEEGEVTLTEEVA